MDKNKAIEILKDFNDYRRNEGIYDVDEPCEPKFKASEIGEAIDMAIGALVDSDNNDMTIIDAVAAEAGISQKALLGDGRDRNLVVARCVVAWKMRNDGFTLKEIGVAINRTHSAIANLLEEVECWILMPEQYRRELRLLERVKKRLGVK